MPPADLVEQLIPETAYAYELRGARRQQAWENVKKMRGLIRRVQNRGYATLVRIADHIDSLTAGDESNAVLEALDAVNLMTVHASKGLEFPVVFVVNLARGATGFPRPVRVSGEDVSVGPFVSETDEDEKTREREETKRLLYVALTRARDRLYLGAVVKDGALSLGRGSLAEVLPDSFRTLFVRAAAEAAGSVIEWTSALDRAYRFRVCGNTGDGVEIPRKGTQRAVEPVNNLEPLRDREAVERLTVTQAADAEPRDPAIRLARDPDGGFDDRLTGTLVHRLFQHAGDVPGATSDAPIGELAQRLLRPEERVAAVDAGAAVRRAAAVWESMKRQPEVAAVLASGDRIHEVPFSLVTCGQPARVTRGTIDCLVRRPDGSIVIVEFKTGRPTPSHQAQLDVYVQAACVMYPDVPVSGLLVYPA
jgi:ATP-dependent helicase/nuclease subunit A